MQTLRAQCVFSRHSLTGNSCKPLACRPARTATRSYLIAQCSARPVQLPNSAVWYQGAAHLDVLFGDSFILQRNKQGGPGLVLSPRLSSLDIVDKQERQAAVSRFQQQQSGTLMPEVHFDFLDVLEYTISDVPPSYPPTDSVGIVPVNLGGAEQDTDTEQVYTKHERRTKAVRYTCKLCGTTSLKAVNPHAWTEGSVFGRCDGCGVVHKIVDNLNVFHEMKGDVFAPRIDAAKITIPGSLPQKPYMP